MGDDLNILLKAMLNISDSKKTLRMQIDDLQKQLKPLNISFNVGNVDKIVKDVNNSLGKVGKNGSKGSVSGFKKALEDTIHQYKIGMMDIETYAKRMQSIMFGNGSTYKKDLFKLSNSDQEKYIAKLQSAQNDVSKGLDSVYNTNAKINEQQEKYANNVEKSKQAIGELVAKSRELGNDFSGFIDEKELSKIRRELSAIDVNSEEIDSSFKGVNESIKKAGKSLEDVENKAKKTRDAVQLAQIKQSEDNDKAKSKLEYDIDKAHYQALKKNEELKQKAYNEEVTQLEYIRKKKQQVSEIDRQINKAKFEKGIDIDYSEILSIQDKLNSFYEEGNVLNKEHKQIVEAMIADLQMKLKLEKDSVEIADKKIAAESRANILKSKIDDTIVKNDKYDKDAYRKLKEDIDELIVAYAKGGMAANKFEQEMKELEARASSFGVEAKKLSSTTNSFSDSLKRFTAFYGIYDVLQLGKRTISSMVDSVFELDHALVELQKTSDLTGASLDNFVNDAYAIGENLARTGTEVINASAEFSKAGYSGNELANLAQTALLLTNVGDGISDVADASGTLISAMKGFGIESQNAINIVDKINAVSNSTASNFEDISFGLERMSGTLGMAGASIDETIGMFTAVNEVLRNSEIVSSGLNSLFMRMRGLSEETGESVDGLSSKLGDLYATVGIDMVDKNGQLRDTFDVLSDLSKVWDDMSVNQKQYFAQESAGIRQAKVFTTLMEQFSTVNNSIATSLNSSGSAMSENEKYLNSLEGKVNNVKSAFEQLAATTVNSDFVKGILDTTANILKLTTSIGGLIPVLTTVLGIIISIKAQSIASWIGGLGKVITSLLTPLGMLTTGALSAKNAMMLLNASMMANPLGILVGGAGLAVASLGALTSGMIYASKESERLEEKISSLNDEMSNKSMEYDRATGLAKQYSELNKLSKAQGLNNEQQQEYHRIQNELKDIMPDVNGYYDEQGNFIITQTDLLRDLNEEYEVYISNKKKERAETAKSLSKDRLDGLEKELQYQKDAMKQIEDLKKRNQDEKAFTSGAIGEYDDRTVAEVVEGIENAINDSKTRISEHSKNMQSDILSVASATEEWGNLTKEQNSAIRKFISDQDADYLKKYEEQLNNNTFSVEEFIGTLLNEKSVIATVNELTKENTKSNLDNATSKDDQIKSIEEYAGLLDELIGKQSGYKNILDELNESNGISAKTLAEIAKEYPELLGFMGDEETLRNKLVELIGSQEREVQDMYAKMVGASSDYYNAELMQSEDYYNAKILGDETLYKNLTGAIEEYFNNLGAAYQGDLKNYQTLEQAKAKTTEDLIKQLAGAWSKYYNVTAKSVTLDSSFIDQYGAHGTHMYGAYKYLEEAKDFQKQFQSIANTINIDPINIDFTGGGNKKGSGSNGSKKDTIADEFRKQLNEISKLREDKEREITELQEAINLDELLGEYDPNKANKMTVLKDQLRGISEVQIGRFEGLAKLYKDTEQLGELESLIADARKQGYIDEQSYIQHTIDLLNKKYETEKRAYDDKLRLLSYEQEYTHEDSKEYADIEQQKLDMVVAMQKSCMEKIRQLKESGLSDEQEDVRKYIDLYKDMLEEQLNLEKSMAEKRKQLELDRLNDLQDDLGDKQSAMKSYIDMVMQMLRDQYNEEKKMIEDNYKLKQDKLKQELDSYKKIIDAKKKSLEDEANTEDYNDEVAKRQKELADMKANAALLGKDETAKAQYEKLLEEIAQKEKDLAKYQRDHNIKLQQESLDKEYDIYEDNINNELDALEKQKESELEHVQKMLDSEVELRRRAIQLIEQDNDKLYKQLKKWAEETGKKTQEEVSDAWKGCTDAINTYNDGQMNVLDTLTKIADKLKEVKVDIDDVSNSHWTDFDNNPSTGNGGSYNKPSDNAEKTIDKMRENSKKWASAKTQEERDKIYEENQRLGKAAGLTYDSSTGIWYRDKEKKIRAYSKGGLAKTTGLAMLHGSEVDPERVLSAQQTRAFDEMVSYIPRFNMNMDKLLNKNSNMGEVTVTFDTLMKVDKIEKDVDVDGLLKKANDMFIKTIKSTLNMRGIK